MCCVVLSILVSLLLLHRHCCGYIFFSFRRSAWRAYGMREGLGQGVAVCRWLAMKSERQSWGVVFFIVYLTFQSFYFILFYFTLFDFFYFILLCFILVLLLSLWACSAFDSLLLCCCCALHFHCSL